MQTILYNISQVTGVAIIHSLWQGLVIYLLLRLLLAVSAGLSSAVKHHIAFTALLGMTAWFVYTLISEIGSYTWVRVKPAGQGLLQIFKGLPVHAGQGAGYTEQYHYTIGWLLPYITAVYLTGLLFNTARLLWSRKQISDIRQNMSIDFQLQLKVAQFAGLLNIGSKVQFGLSKLVDVPCVVGYLKPVILLPFSLSTHLTADEIEIIILHELAHIKRNDYLYNLAQQAMSVLLFFNPFAQLTCRIINNERENSCDDMVIQATKKPLVYAHALLKLEEGRERQWQLALAATGKKYHLLNRIERIMKTKKEPIGNTRHIILAVTLLIATITGLAWLNPTIANGKLSVNRVKPLLTENYLADTLHKGEAKTAKSPVAKKARVKTVHIEKNGAIYNGFNDAELDKLSAEVSKHGDAISRYFDSPQFKKLQDEMEKSSQAMENFDNNPQFKRMQEEMEKRSAEFDRLNNNPEIQKLQEQTEKLNSEIEKYYNSPQFKKLQKEVETNSAALGKLKYDSPEFKKESEYVAQLSKQLQDYSQSSAIKQQEEDIRKMGLQIRDYFNSPEYVKQRDDLRLYGDSIRKVYQDPQFKMQQDEIRKLGKQMQAMQNNPQIKKEQELMKQATDRMKAYMNSPEFKKRMEQYKNEATNYWNDEKPGRPEKPEAPEKPEVQEKPDSTGN